MKRSLMVFAALAALAIPTMIPLNAKAQEATDDRGQEDLARAPGQRDGARGPRRDVQATVDVEGRVSGDRSTRFQDSPPRDERPAEPERPRTPDRPSRPSDDLVQGRGGQDRPTRPDRPNGGEDRDRGGQDRPNRPDRFERPSTDGGAQSRPDRPVTRPDDGRWTRGQGPGQDQGRPSRPDRPNSDRPNSDRPNRPDRSSGWSSNWNDNRNDRDGPRRDRSQYRDFQNRFDANRWQQDWNRSHRSDWWQNDRRFRGWSGVRLGFYFAPGYGYYSVPRSYYGQRFYEGQYLPSIFWRYQLNDYRTYGLGYPPEGTRWVYVDTSIYLIDAYDGYIIDVVRNAWRW